MTQTQRRRPTARSAPTITISAPARIPRSDQRAYRIRRWACRELDKLLYGPTKPLVLAEPIDWSDHAMTLQAREFHGRELLAARWSR